MPSRRSFLRTITGSSGPVTATITSSGQSFGTGASRLIAPKMKISEPLKSVVIETWVWLSPAITVSSTACAATGAAGAQTSAARIATAVVNRRVNVRSPSPW